MKYVSLVVLLVFLFVGCGKPASNVKTATVSGTVTIGGKAVDQVEVRFVGTKHEGFGRTNSEGKYELVAGAEVGKNKVFFSKMSGGPAAVKLDPEQGIDEEQMRAAAAADPRTVETQKQLIPGDYSSRENSPISFDVPDGGSTSADFKLPDK